MAATGVLQPDHAQHIGYGDVLPVNPWARMLAGLEATVGVMYVAILMAQLVSLYDRQLRGEK